MAVAHDAASESHTDAASVSQASYSWTHTPSGTPRGVLVFVFNRHTSLDPDIVTVVTYGGVSLTAVTGGAAEDTATERLYTQAWFLGGSVPTGAQSVMITRTNNAVESTAVAATVTATADTETKGTPVLVEEDGLWEEQSVDSGSAEALRYAGCGSGASTPSFLETGTNSTRLLDNDAGGWVSVVVRETTGGAGSRLVGVVETTVDDRAGVHLAVGEVSALGLAASLLSALTQTDTHDPPRLLTRKLLGNRTG